MKPSEYVENAVRTESVPNARVLARMVQHNMTVMSLLHQLVALDERIDPYKRCIFYLKDLPFEKDEKGVIELSSMQLARLMDVARQVHALMGMATELGELAKPLVKYIIDGSQADLINIEEELGDSFWYHAVMADANGLTFEQIMRKNIAKLQKRYPDKFNEKDAIERDLKQEREVLEDKQSSPKPQGEWAMDEVSQQPPLEAYENALAEKVEKQFLGLPCDQCSGVTKHNKNCPTLKARK